MLPLVKQIEKKTGKCYQEKIGYLLQSLYPVKKEMLYKLWKMKPDCNNLKNEYKNYSKLLDEVIKKMLNLN